MKASPLSSAHQESADPGFEKSPLLPATPRRHSWVRRLFTVPFKLAMGALLTQFLLGAVLVFGWLQQWVRRSAIRAWWRSSPTRNREAFEDFAAREPMFREMRFAPNWILGSRGADGRRTAPSWWRNARLGMEGLVNVLILTLPGCGLMLLGWWGGWQNSFHKGYEEAFVGPVVSWLGILSFIVAMLYVPLASARQAVTGRWRAFWQGRVVAVLLRAAWMECALLAALAAALNVGAMGLKSWPYFLPQVEFEQRVRLLLRSGLDRSTALEQAVAAEPKDPGHPEFTDDDARRVLRRHYLASGFYLFGALVLLRGITARVYARAVLRAVRKGSLAEDQLGGDEWRILHTLQHLQPPSQPRHGLSRRALTWAALRTWRLIAASIALAGWLGFVASVYVSEFFNHHPVIGWLNQPLVQIPWFRYFPAHLESPAIEPLLALLVLGGGAFAARLFRRRAEPVPPGPSTRS